MPNRIIKESICTSENIDSLSWFEEVFFYRLMVNCDDYGRLDARPAIIKSKLFPLKHITHEQITQTLNKLSTEGMVILYEVDGKPYLQLVTWKKHQQVRATKSKYPAPDINGYQPISDETKCPRNPIQSYSITNTESNPNTSFYLSELQPPKVVDNSVENHSEPDWLKKAKESQQRLIEAGAISEETAIAIGGIMKARKDRGEIPDA